MDIYKVTIWVIGIALPNYAYPDANSIDKAILTFTFVAAVGVWRNRND